MKKNSERKEIKNSNLENVAGGYATYDENSNVPSVPQHVVLGANGVVKIVYSTKKEAEGMAHNK